MSFSEPKLENPATKFIDFRDGKFQYYDKEQEKNIQIELPIYFVVLDELSTISGFCEKHNCGIYSNEVHRITDEILKVKTFKGGEQIIGFYKDISDAVARLGGKFTKSVYGMLCTKDGNELVNFKFRGAAFSGWLDKKFNPNKYGVHITGTVEATKGKTVYQVPVFKAFNLKDELTEQAIVLDQQLQIYLKDYKSHQVEKEAVKTEEVKEEATDEITANEKWMGGNVKEQIMERKAKEPVPVDDDLPFN